MAKINTLLLVLFWIAGMLFVTFRVRAQEDQDASRASAPTASESGLSTDQIFTKPRQTAEILRLRELYQAQVERYTNLEREYLINKAQFEKLGTLQSLEEAVKSTREVMLARTDVLITYFELMRASLADTEGVELTQKQQNIDEMVSYIEGLRTHRDQLLKTSEREGIAERADEFEILSAPFESTAYKSLALIRTGDIQTVFDQALIIYEDVKRHHVANPTQPLLQQERERAYKQVDQSIEITRNDLLLVRNEYGKETSINRSSYNAQLRKNLSTAYSGTTQLLFFLEELFVELT